jgi:hypothetical protein
VIPHFLSRKLGPLAVTPILLVLGVEPLAAGAALVGLLGSTNELAPLGFTARLAAVPAATVAAAAHQHQGAASGAVEESTVAMVVVVCHRPSRTLLDKDSAAGRYRDPAHRAV